MENKKNYLVMAGTIRAKDGDEHFISGEQLARLYMVDHRDCVFVNGDDPRTYLGLDPREYIVLRPRYDGNYSLPEGSG